MADNTRRLLDIAQRPTEVDEILLAQLDAATGSLALTAATVHNSGTAVTGLAVAFDVDDPEQCGNVVRDLFQLLQPHHLVPGFHVGVNPIGVVQIDALRVSVALGTAVARPAAFETVAR